MSMWQPAQSVSRTRARTSPVLDFSLDFVTGLPPSEGNTAVLTVVDRFSKMVRFIPLPKIPSANEMAEVLMFVEFLDFPGMSCLTRVRSVWLRGGELRQCIKLDNGCGCRPRTYLSRWSPVSWPLILLDYSRCQRLLTLCL